MESDLERLFRRLAARGYFEVRPSAEYVVVGTENDGATTTTISEPRFAVAVTWAPRGQAGPGGPLRFNPFCARTWVRPTLAEALAAAVNDTTPLWRSIDSLAWEKACREESADA